MAEGYKTGDLGCQRIGVIDWASTGLFICYFKDKLLLKVMDFDFFFFKWVLVVYFKILKFDLPHNYFIKIIEKS